MNTPIVTDVPTTDRTYAANRRSRHTDDEAGVPLSRLVHVELRKMVDTRAGLWMLLVMGGLTALVVGVVLFTAPPSELIFHTFAGVVGLPLVMLLPILGIMAATSEWSQRTGLVTFTLEPRRGRVVTAKLIAGVLLGLVLIVGSLAFAALANVVGMVARDGNGSWSIPAGVVVGLVVGLSIFVLQGFGFGFVLLNTPAAIVASLVLPTAWTIGSGLSPRLNRIGEWADLNRVVEPLFSGQMASSDWAHLGTGISVWVVLPLAIGIWRVMTREVK